MAEGSGPPPTERKIWQKAYDAADASVTWFKSKVLHTEARSYDRKERKRATSDLTLKAGLKDHKDHGEFVDPVRQERCGIPRTNFCAKLCEEADKLLAKLAEEYSQEITLPTDEISTLRKQLKSREVTISALGRHNCGKSTCLGAVLYCHLLPRSTFNETGVRVRIRHMDHIHQGSCSDEVERSPLIQSKEQQSRSPLIQLKERSLPFQSNDQQPTQSFVKRTFSSEAAVDSYSADKCCQNCPYLELEVDEGRNVVPMQQQPVCSGSNDVRKALEDANKLNRSQQAEASGTQHYIVYTHIPVLSRNKKNVPEGWQVSFSDNPGFGEAEHVNIMQQADTSLRTSAAYLYFVHLKDIGDEVDAKHFKLLHEKDPEVFEDMRVVIVVTHFDETITKPQLQDEDVVTEAVIKEKVCKAIKLTTRVENLSRDIIIPVSGLWALLSRLLESSEDYRSHVLTELKKCPSENRAGGQNEDLDQLPSSQLAGMLETLSGIKLVEERIQSMSTKCAEIWLKSIRTNYNSILTDANHKLTSKMEAEGKQLTAQESDLNTKINMCKEIEDLWQSLKLSTSTSSEIQANMKAACELDVQGARRELCRRIEERVDTFKTECEMKLMKAEQQPFGEDEFDNEIDTFLSKVGKHLEDDINVAVSFGNIYSVFTSKLETMTKDGATMKVKTEQYLQHSVELTDSEDTLPVPEKIRELYPAPPKYNELKTKVTIPPLQLTRKQRFAARMRKLLHLSPKKASYSGWNKQHDTAIEDLRQNVQECMQKHLDAIQPKVVEFFFEKYCKHTNSWLDPSQEHFTKVKELKEEKENEVQSLKEKLETTGKFQKDVQKLRVNL